MSKLSHRLSPLTLLGLAFVACQETPSTTPATAESAAPKASTSSASPAPTAPAAPSASAKPAGTECRVKSGGKSVYAGPCTFKTEGGNGSFSIAPIGMPSIEGANPVSVSITSPGVAEVRGLTAEGINSRWGEAKRSATDGACWTGADFEVCAYAAGAGAAPTDATAARAVAQQQGSEYWAVYTASGGKLTDPAVKAAIATLSTRGLEFGKTFGFGSLDCDVGAAAALKASGDTNALGVYFATEADAKAFAATVTPSSLAVVKIKAMCRD